MGCGLALINCWFDNLSSPPADLKLGTVTCPTSGGVFDRIKGAKTIQVQNQRAIWWQCPACKSWHILLNQRQSD